MWVNGESRASLEDTATVKGSELGDTLYLRAVSGKIEFRNFKID